MTVCKIIIYQRLHVLIVIQEKLVVMRFVKNMHREGREQIYKDNKISVDVQGYFQVELEKNIFGRGRRIKRHE